MVSWMKWNCLDGIVDEMELSNGIVDEMELS